MWRRRKRRTKDEDKMLLEASDGPVFGEILDVEIVHMEWDQVDSN